MTRATRIRAVLCGCFLAFGVAPAARATVRDTDGAVHVTWTASASAEVVGYHVYRSAGATGPYTRITAEPVAEFGYVDTAVDDGGVYFYAASAVDAAGRESDAAQAQTGVLVQIDRAAPLVLSHAPFAQQGCTADRYGRARAVPVDSSVFVRVWDDTGVNAAAVEFAVAVNGQPVAGATSVHPAVGTDPTDLFAQFIPRQRFPFGAQVHVRVTASDRAGNTMPAYQFDFRTATAAQTAAAAAGAPATTLSQLPDGTRILQSAGVSASIPADETRIVSFGETSATGAWVHLDRIQYYAAPVTVSFALGRLELQRASTIEVLRYDEETRSWTVATVGDGWLVSLNVVDGAAQLEIAHSAAIALAFGT